VRQERNDAGERYRENDGIRSGETVFADLDRLCRLPAGVEIDAVGQELRTKPADRRERANPHARSAIKQVPAANAGMPFDDQLRRRSVWCAKWRLDPLGKPVDPIQLPDNRARAEMEQIDVLAKREVTDP